MSYNHNGKSYSSQDVRSGRNGNSNTGGGSWWGNSGSNPSSNTGSSLTRAMNNTSGHSNRSTGWGNSSSASNKQPQRYGQSGSGGGSRQQPKGGGPKVRGQTMAFWHECFVCACCMIEISGPDSLVQHCMGKNHAKKNRGKRGFAGIVANKAGITPEVSQALIDRCSTGMGTTSSLGGGRGGGKGGGMVNQEKLGVVGLSAQSSAMVLDALRKNKSEKVRIDGKWKAKTARITNATLPLPSSPPPLLPPPSPCRTWPRWTLKHPLPPFLPRTPPQTSPLSPTTSEPSPTPTPTTAANSPASSPPKAGGRPASGTTAPISTLPPTSPRAAQWTRSESPFPSTPSASSF